MSNASIYTNSYIQQIQSISLPNKYTKWYCQIVNRAQQRATTKKQAEFLCKSKIEKHHILPKSFELGGSKDKLNYAFLTSREHFICHWLLPKMLIGKEKAKMIYALTGMQRQSKNHNRYETKITSKVYARNKKEFSQLMSTLHKGKIVSDATRRKMSNSLNGRISGMDGKSHSLNTCSHLSNINKGKVLSEETRKKMSEARKGKSSPNKGKAMSQEQKDKISSANKGKSKPPRTAEHCANISRAKQR